MKKLRDATGAGMMDSKKALEEADGDFDKAVEVLRVKGSAKAAKRGAERTAANGLVAAAESAMIELHLRDRLRGEERAVPDAGRRYRRALLGSTATDVESLLASSWPTAQPSPRTSRASPQ